MRISEAYAIGAVPFGFTSDRGAILREGVPTTRTKLQIHCEKLLIISRRFSGLRHSTSSSSSGQDEERQCHAAAGKMCLAYRLDIRFVASDHAVEISCSRGKYVRVKGNMYFFSFLRRRLCIVLLAVVGL